ncbi:MAG: ParB N-terminal domain-containing protein [Acetatifactor sp.]|nr:ParB N-terminal domain-containing protein [Acetatifactor sp.]
MAAARGLGKGLDVMIPNIVGETKEKKQKLGTREEAPETTIAITKVEPNRKQPRKVFDEDKLQELADSIKQFGMLQPIVVQDRNCLVYTSDAADE